MERVQKAMARTAIASRRASERLTVEGRALINGEPAQLGDRVELGRGYLEVDGQPVLGPEDLIYVLLHKPAGVLSSSRSQGGHRTVVHLDSLPARLYPNGRLDLASESR